MVHYEKRVVRLLETPSTQPRTSPLVYRPLGVECYDTNTGRVASDSSKCDYIEGPSNKDRYNLPSTFNHATQMIYIPESEVRKYINSGSETDITDFYRRSINIYNSGSSGSSKSYTLTNDPSKM